MGRYYSGDIDGKFWFATQSSNDADFFGVTGYKPEKLEYDFEEEHLDLINEGINKCLKEIGVKRGKIFKWFKKEDNLNPYKMEEGIIPKNTSHEWLARLELGMRILKSVEATGGCYFEAEL
jgi:hypothetical protein